MNVLSGWATLNEEVGVSVNWGFERMEACLRGWRNTTRMTLEMDS